MSDIERRQEHEILTYILFGYLPTVMWLVCGRKMFLVVGCGLKKFGQWWHDEYDEG